MFSRSLISTGLALVLTLLLVFPAFAGGWAVITLDELPTNVIAGKPLTIGFTVRQHGRTPMNGLEPTVTATLLKEQFVVYAESDDQPGHYTTRLTFPEPGDWSWSIQAFSMDQRMPLLSVAAPVSAASNPSMPKTEPEEASFSLLWIIRALAFGVGITGLILALQRKSRLALGLTALALSIGLASFLMGSGVSHAEAQVQDELTSERSDHSSPSQVEIGRQLFIAKGCITCHYNDRAGSRADYWTIEMGAPDLTKYSAHPEVLFIRLKDPVAAKSDTKMPNLGLKETEIQALIAFINSK